MFTSSALINVDLYVTMEVFNSNSTAQSNAVEGPLRDLTDGAAPKASKSDFASNVSRFFESRKMKVTKNPPPPPARITKGSFSEIFPSYNEHLYVTSNFDVLTFCYNLLLLLKSVLLRGMKFPVLIFEKGNRV